MDNWILQDPSKRGSSAKKRRRQQMELESEDSDAPPELLIDEQGNGSPFSQQSISPFVDFLPSRYLDRYPILDDVNSNFSEKVVIIFVSECGINGSKL
jgi:hypothetical protein